MSFYSQINLAICNLTSLYPLMRMYQVERTIPEVTAGAQRQDVHVVLPFHLETLIKKVSDEEDSTTNLLSGICSSSPRQ